MPLRVSGKNINIGAALQRKIIERVEEATSKYVRGRYSGHATVGKDGFGFRTECVLHLDSGALLEAEGMSILSFLLNVLWIVCGGLWMAVAWIVAAVIMAITIIGLPWARAAFNIALYTLLPFGQTAVSREEFLGVDDIGTGFLGFVGNLVWLVLAGWWLAIGHEFAYSLAAAA